MSGISSKNMITNTEAETVIKRHTGIRVNGKWETVKKPDMPSDKEYRVMRKLVSFNQKEPPRRGAFTSMSVKEAEQWVSRVTNEVMKKLSAKGPKFAEYYAGEETQIGAKGPVVIEGNECLEAYDKLAENSRVNLIDPKNIKLIDKIIYKTVTSAFAGKPGFNGKASASFNHAQAGAEMTGSTLRGLPYDQHGNEELQLSNGKKVTVDVHMMNGLGSDTPTVLQRVREGVEKVGESNNGKFFKIAVTRNRMQSPNKGRIVSVVIALLQYAKLPFVHDFIDSAKAVTYYSAGWLPPLAREKRIKEMCDAKFQNRKLSDVALPFSIDFSKFDQRQDLYVMEKANSAAWMMRYGTNNKNLKKLLNMLEFVESKKVIIRPGRSFHIALQGAKNLLDSGDVDTSSKGTNMSRTFSVGILMNLRQPEVFFDKTLNLGDDTVIGILKKTVKEMGGIKATNEHISKFLSQTFGTVLNVDKQLPVKVSPAFEYLQRFYLNETGLMGLYSLNRALGSLVGPERFQAEVRGIRNIPALQMIGQVSTLNETVIHPMTTYHNDEIVQNVILREGLKTDVYLANLIRVALVKQRSIEEASILWFYYLCAAAGGIRPVVRDSGGLGGAETNQDRLNQFRQDRLLSSLPILTMMTKCIQTNGVNQTITESEIMKFFGTKTKISKTNKLYDELLNHGFSA